LPRPKVPLISKRKTLEAALRIIDTEGLDSLSVRQQIGVAALLFAVALVLIVVAHPQGLGDGKKQPTSVDVGSVYP